jgi:hypothetical protein
MVILPDTAKMRDRIDAFLAGRVRQIPEVAPYVPGAPRDPADFLRFPMVRTVCNVTGLLRAGQWEDAAGLEAARMLLLKRFDLKLGLWDLALNPVLRSTVLDPVPVRRTPKESVQAPISAHQRAEREAKKATARREAAQRALGKVAAALQQELAMFGWCFDERGRLCLPLTEPLSDWPGTPEHPLASLMIEVNKGSLYLFVCHQFQNNLNIRDFIERKREAFESVALLPPLPDHGPVPLWTASVGWGDADADWSSTARTIAEHTNRWIELLADFVASCRSIRRTRSEHYSRSSVPKVKLPRIVGELNKWMVGYRMKVWLQCSEENERELLMKSWTLSPSAGVKIIKRIARKRGLSDSWEAITSLDY